MLGGTSLARPRTLSTAKIRYGSLARLDLHRHSSLDPEMEEAPDRPPAMILIDNHFAVYRNHRRALISGDAPRGGGRLEETRSPCPSTHPQRASLKSLRKETGGDVS